MIRTIAVIASTIALSAFAQFAPGATGIVAVKRAGQAEDTVRFTLW